jgi:hypothetical protein
MWACNPYRAEDGRKDCWVSRRVSDYDLFYFLWQETAPWGSPAMHYLKNADRREVGWIESSKVQEVGCFRARKAARAKKKQ